MSGMGFLDKFVLCPYYDHLYNDNRRNRNLISCEGVEGAKKVEVIFNSREDMLRYVKERCTSNYCLCPICRGLHEYYEGD